MLLQRTIPACVPAGVIRASNDAANFGQGENGLAPRIGFAWQPLGAASRFVVRSGYGIYFSQPTGQAFFQSVFGAPFSFGYENIGGANAAATFNNPFPQPFPTPSFFPYFPPYSPTSDVAISIVSPDFRPAMIQEYGLNFQVALAKDWMLEVGYVGNARHALAEKPLSEPGTAGHYGELHSRCHFEYSGKHRVAGTSSRSAARRAGHGRIRGRLFL